jgi:hypothetical protein
VTNLRDEDLHSQLQRHLDLGRCHVASLVDKCEVCSGSKSRKRWKKVWRASWGDSRVQIYIRCPRLAAGIFEPITIVCCASQLDGRRRYQSHASRWIGYWTYIHILMAVVHAEDHGVGVCDGFAGI